MPEEANIPSNFDVAQWLVDQDISACTTNPAMQPGDEGKLRFECDMSHLSYNDPIVYPGQAGAAHLHMFYGNPGVDHNTTYQSLRSSGVSTCAGGGINRSAYWFPAMIRPQNNKVVKPDFITLYYTINRRDLQPVISPNPEFGTQFAAQDFPRGIKFVWGHKHGDLKPHGVWLCEAGSPRDFTLQDTFLGTIADVAAAGCAPPNRLTARTHSPNCWDGVNLDSADHRSHMAYMRQDSYGNNMCPATHPYPVPQLTLLIWFSHNGPSDFGQWYVSSDKHGHHDDPGGFSFHADYMEAWDRTIYDIVNKEIHGMNGGTVRTSGGGGLCNGKALKESHLELNNYLAVGRPESVRYLDIPPPPGVIEPPPPPPPDPDPVPPPPPPPPPPVTIPPTISIATPANGIIIRGNGSVTISANASRAGTIVISADGKVLQTCNGGTSCSVTWSGKAISQGMHTITAKVTDAGGLSGMASVTIKKR